MTLRPWMGVAGRGDWIQQGETKARPAMEGRARSRPGLDQEVPRAPRKKPSNTVTLMLKMRRQVRNQVKGWENAGARGPGMAELTTEVRPIFEASDFHWANKENRC